MTDRIGAWICHDCGTKYGRVINNHCATYHCGDRCDYCGRTDQAVTEPRDYGYPKLPEKVRANE